MIWILGFAVLLTACQEPPTRMLPSESDAWADMAAWFAERGLHIPVQIPSHLAGKSISVTGGLIGDIDETGRVDFHDALLLFLWLSNSNLPVTFNGQNLADIDRSGTTDWEDLWHLGTWLFAEPRPPNVFRVGQPLVVEGADSTFDIELVFARTQALRFRTESVQAGS